MNEIKTVKLTKLMIGDKPFYSNGISTIKVTRINKKGENVEEYISIPIQSVGIPELLEELETNKPKPPTKQIFIKKDSELGRQLELNRGAVVIAFDTTNKEYCRQIDKYTENKGWEMLLKAVCIEFVDEAGNEITNKETKKKALMNSGITYNQMNQIINDTTNLTTKMEDEADFLSETPLD